jgi:prophage DNA circulation protein
MSWRDQLRPSSFRDVPFYVDEAEYKGGRRIVGFEFPKLSTPATEDMGRKQRTYAVQAYVLGEDYLDVKNALIEACEAEGAGILVHPYMGELNVQCQEIAVKESMKEGGIALVSMSFIEAGQELYPDAAADKFSALNTSKLAAIASVKDDFKSKYSVVGKGQLLINSASSKVSTWADKMESSLKSVKGRADAVNDLGYSIRNLKADVMDTVTRPATLANILSDSISGLGATLTLDDMGGALDAYKSLYKVDNSESYLTNPLTETRRQENTNSKAIDDLVVNVAILEASEQAAYVNYSSYEDASAMQEELLENIDKVLESTDNDDVYLNFSSMRALVVDLIPAQDQNLPSLMKVSLTGMETSLSLAYRLYGNISNEEDILARNKIKHPAFIPAEKQLEVLSE